GGRGRRIRRIDEAGRLRRRTGEVERHLVARHADGQVDLHPRAVVDAVVESPALDAVDAVGDGGDLPAHHAFGRGEQIDYTGVEAFVIKPPEQVLHAALADPDGADLRLDVFLDDAVADIGEDHPPHVAPQFARRVNLDRRDAQGLLPDFPGFGVVAARLRPADVGLMALAGGPGRELAAAKDRAEHRHVVVLVAAR